MRKLSSVMVMLSLIVSLVIPAHGHHHDFAMITNDDLLERAQEATFLDHVHTNHRMKGHDEMSSNEGSPPQADNCCSAWCGNCIFLSGHTKLLSTSSDSLFSSYPPAPFLSRYLNLPKRPPRA